MWGGVVSRTVGQADLLVDYSPDWQREGTRAMEIAAYVREHRLKPLHEVILSGRAYVRIYAGPRLSEHPE